MNENRTKRWVTASFGIAQFEHYLPVVIQSLGRLDVQLLARDEKLLAGLQNQSETEILNLNDSLTFSYLWVLGSYEVIRTICQRIQESPTSIPSKVATSFQALKTEIARLRMPLAKLEAAKAHRETDSSIAYPTITEGHGISWQLNKSTIITRYSLSESFLNALEEARQHDPNLP